MIGVRESGPNFYGTVQVDGKAHYTRTFPCPILAAAARDVLAWQLHGEFATLNFEFRRVA